MAATNLPARAQASRHDAATATVAFAGSACFALIIVALHALRPDVDPVLRTTSEYAVGQYGYLMSSAFLSMSVASLALVLGLARGLARPARSRLGLSMLGVWAGALLMAMLFPINPYGTPPTLAGTVHRINGPIAFLSLTVGVILVSRRLRHDQRWQPLYRFALLASLVMLLLCIGTIVSIAGETGFAGLFQRLYLSVFVTWALLLAARLRSLAATAG